jgi:septal ring factor EnvC (AmiA/AmiB activator)
MEEKEHYEYTNLIEIHVVDLTNIGLATENDKKYGTDKWAALFKAKTWEELKMLEQEDARIGTAADTVFRLMCDDKVRMQMEAREDFYRIMDSYKEELEEQKSKIDEQNTKIEKQSRELAAANNQIKEKDRLIAELQAALSKTK